MVAFQPNMQVVPDDLAALFSRNLTLGAIPTQQPQQQQQFGSEEKMAMNMAASTPAAAPQPQSPIVYSISQHYTQPVSIPRAAPAVPQQQPQMHVETPQRAASVPPAEPPTDAILHSHGIDPSLLTPPQLELFRSADDEQKLRLLQLWTIAPLRERPATSISPGGALTQPDVSLAWTSTSMEHEITLARMRNAAFDYEWQMHQLQEQQAQQAPYHTTMSLDGTAVQSNDGRWMPYEHTEPYMMTGYEEMMRREAERESRERSMRATDPVYRTGGVGVAPIFGEPAHAQMRQDRVDTQLQMENAYGAFEQMRNMDAMEMV